MKKSRERINHRSERSRMERATLLFPRDENVTVDPVSHFLRGLLPPTARSRRNKENKRVSACLILMKPRWAINSERGREKREDTRYVYGMTEFGVK